MLLLLPWLPLFSCLAGCNYDDEYLLSDLAITTTQFLLYLFFFRPIVASSIVLQ